MAKRLSWAVRIERAELAGKFTDEDKVLSGHWATCAVGEKHNWQEIGDDWDDDFFPGINFCQFVCADNIPEAKRLYAEIMALP